MQIQHHVLTETLSLKGKFDLKGSTTILKIFKLPCHISWFLSYVDNFPRRARTEIY